MKVLSAKLPDSLFFALNRPVRKSSQTVRPGLGSFYAGNFPVPAHRQPGILPGELPCGSNFRHT
jgi:hypothetical protein